MCQGAGLEATIMARPGAERLAVASAAGDEAAAAVSSGGISFLRPTQRRSTGAAWNAGSS